MGFIRVERRLYGFLSRHEPYLCRVLRPQPRERGRDDALNREAPRQPVAKRPPVEALVIVKRQPRTADVVYRSDDVGPASREHALDILLERVGTRARIVADTAPARDAARRLLDDERQPGLDRHADDQRTVVREHAMQPIDDDVEFDDVLE